MSNEGRVFALHAWWQYHVDRAELDATWTLRWEAYLAAGGSGPKLSEMALRLRWRLEAELPTGTLLREGERGDCAAFLSPEECWDPCTHMPTDYLMTGRRPVGSSAPRKPPELPQEPLPPSQEAPSPRKRARRAKPAQSAPKEDVPKQSSFDDLRKEFGL